MLIFRTRSAAFRKRAIGKSNGKNRRKPNKRGKIKPKKRIRAAVFSKWKKALRVERLTTTYIIMGMGF
jgi:hypothetical protein